MFLLSLTVNLRNYQEWRRRLLTSAGKPSFTGYHSFLKIIIVTCQIKWNTILSNSNKLREELSYLNSTKIPQSQLQRTIKQLVVENLVLIALREAVTNWA